MKINRRNLFSLPALLAGTSEKKNPAIPKFISEAKHLHICPGDVIVYRTENRLKASQAESMMKSHRELFGDTKGIVLEEGMDIGIINKRR